jgi:S-adenosylmethionine hydrolase
VRLSQLVRSYAAASPGSPVLVVGSMGYLEVAVNLESAAHLLGLRVGDPIRATWRV